MSDQPQAHPGQASTPPASQRQPGADPDDTGSSSPEDDSERGPQDLGRQFLGRASQPGDTGERLDVERDARSSFARADVHAQHVVGRDQYNIVVGPGGSSVRLYAVSAEELDEVSSAFVAGGGFTRIRDLARDRHALLLRAPSGAGKDAAARRLLVGVGVRRVYRLHPSTDLGSLSTGTLKPGGYLLADLPSSAGSQVKAFDIERLAAELRTVDCRLIVTVTPEVRFGDQDVARHVLDLGTAPDRRAVLEAQLRWRLGPSSAATARQLLARDDVVSLVERELGADRPLRQVAELARLLAEADAAGGDIAATVSARLASSSGEDFRQWIESLPNLATQCLAVGVATLGGESYETVAVASAQLQRRLEPPETPDNPKRPRSKPLDPSRGPRLKALHAGVMVSNLPTRHGGAPGLVVRFHDPTIPQRVLLHFWHEFDDLRPALLAWLRECARHELQTVRVRAAVATGILTGQAFDHIRSTIILPWASDRDPRLREAAATALRVAAGEPGLDTVVRSLVKAWSAESEKPRLQATAVRAWRVELDTRGTRDALALLEELSASKHVIVKETVCDSVSELIEIDAGAHAADALGLLVRWVLAPPPEGAWSSGRLERRLTGMLAFLLAAADLVRQVPASSGPERTITWPALLHLAARDPARHREIAALWHVALASHDLNEPAKEILTEWALMVDGEQVVCRSLARLLGTATTTDRMYRIVHRLASTWARPGSRSAPRASADVHAVLERRPQQGRPSQ